MNVATDISISVVICTYNPRIDYIRKVLNALKAQSLCTERWELIIVDNKSAKSFGDDIDISWHPNAKIILEPVAGLANARIRGVDEAMAQLIVFVDDDNILDSRYLEISWQFHKENPLVGCFGGKSLPVFEVDPPEWFYRTGINLGCQEYGDDLYISNYKTSHYILDKYPENAPIGTGMVITRAAFLSYQNEVANSIQRLRLGRKGSELTSGEDNDIIITIVKNGYEIAYVPQLIVHHLIPASRIAPNYLSKMAYQSNHSWIKVLLYHQICPFALIPKWSVLPRKMKAWFVFKVWLSPVNHIKWKGACGMYDSLSSHG